jgi:hypothetical protein
VEKLKRRREEEEVDETRENGIRGGGAPASRGISWDL